jgi:hypothetical protein
MMKLLAQFAAQAGPVSRSEPSEARATTLAFSHAQAVGCIPALIVALAICGVLGGISLLVPPFISWDSANGFLAWRGTVLGAPNCIISVDHEDIARDTAWFLTVWSPGQYLVPGAISLLGVPLGTAMTLTVALALLASLIGWIMVVREFSPRTSLTILVVVLIGSFHYSTHAFSSYHGGEILLQAATPWLVLAGYRVPELKVIPAALLAAGAVFFAFLAKLTGLIIIAAALIGAGMVRLAFGRRITRGMIGGALGSLAALAVLSVAFFSRGPTAASVTSWSMPLDSIAFTSLVPWVAGISWWDPIGTIYSLLTNAYVWQMPAQYLVLVLPPALLISGLVLLWRPETIGEKKLRLFSLWFYGVVATVFILLFVGGGAISLEERHFRSAGTLLFVCALLSAFVAGIRRWIRGSFLVLSVLMAFYGLASFSYHELTTAKGQFLDRTSWTNQKIFDASAIDFARGIYAREGRDALFVLPSYQIAVALPIEARILVIDLNYDGDLLRISHPYAGRVPGHLVVLLPNSSDNSKGRALLSAFRDYAPEAWERKTFPEMSVYYQHKNLSHHSVNTG